MASNHTPGPLHTEAVSDAVRIIAYIPSRDGMARRPGGILERPHRLDAGLKG
jgi:hypothetical protein